MKMSERFVYKHGDSAWMLPVVLLSGYVILDWNVSRSGGFGILAGILPVVPLIFLLFVASVVSAAFVGIILMISRKYLYFFGWLLGVGGLIAYAVHDHERIAQRGLRDSQNALYVMLMSPERESIWFYDTSLDIQALKIENKNRVEARFLNSDALNHTYRYSVRNSGFPAFKVEVLLLRNENRFIIKKL